MPSNPGVSIEISAEDQASAIIAQIEKSLTGMQKSARRSKAAQQDSVSALLGYGPALKGVQGVAHGLRDISVHASEALTMVSRLVTPLGALGAAGTIAGLGAAAEHFASWGNHLEQTSARARVTTQAMQKLQDAAQLVGGDASAAAMPAALTHLHDAAVNAKWGQDGAASAMFHQLGIDPAKAAAEPTDQLFEQIRQIMPGMFAKDPTNAEKMSSVFFGGGPALDPVIRRTADQWKGDEKDAVAADPAQSAQQIQDAQKLYRSYQDLRLSIQGVENEVMSNLAPALTPLMNDFATFLKGNQGEIGADAKEFGDWLRTIDWSKIGRDIHGDAAEVKAIIDDLGGWKTAIELLGVAWAANSPVGLLAKDLTKLTAMTIPRWVAILLGLGPEGTPLVVAGAAAAGATYLNGQKEAASLASGQPTYDDASGTWIPGSGVPTTSSNTDTANTAFAEVLRNTGLNPDGFLGGASPKGRLLNASPALAKTLDVTSEKYGVDPSQIRALVNAESGGRMIQNPNSSAFGFFQLTDATAQSEGVDSHDPVGNVVGGVSHYSKALAATHNIDAAVASYHDGLNSAGLTWYQAHPGDMSHFSSAGLDEVKKFEANLAAERGALVPAAGAPAVAVPSGPAVTPVDPTAAAGTGPHGNSVLHVRMSGAPPGTTMQTEQHGDDYQVQPLPTSVPS